MKHRWNSNRTVFEFGTIFFYKIQKREIRIEFGHIFCNNFFGHFSSAWTTLYWTCENIGLTKNTSISKMRITHHTVSIPTDYNAVFVLVSIRGSQKRCVPFQSPLMRSSTNAHVDGCNSDCDKTRKYWTCY